MNSLLTSIAGQFLKPVLLSALLPVIIVTTLFLATTYPLFPVSLAMPDAVLRLDAGWQAAYSTLMALVLAMLLYVLNAPIARLFSGYPWKDVFPGTLLARLRRAEFHRLKTQRDGLYSLLASLDAAVPAEDGLADRLMAALTPLARRLNEDFPYGEELVLPTKLGNVIRNFEDYSRQQYGISAVPLWPRLLGSIDARYATLLDDAKTSFDFALNCMFLCGCAAILTLVLALVHDAHGGLLGAALLRVALFAVLAALAYAAAVNRARDWGSYVKAAIDLYRNALFKLLGYQYTFVDIADERTRLWSGLASEWTFPDMSVPTTTVPFAAPGATVTAATQVSSAEGTPLALARGITVPLGTPFATITVTLRIQNTSAADAHGIALRDTVPANWSFVWASPTSSGSAVRVKSTQPLMFELDTLTAGSSCTVTYQLQSLVATPTP